jgi:hypothetical protein
MQNILRQPGFDTLNELQKLQKNEPQGEGGDGLALDRKARGVYNMN